MEYKKIEMENYMVVNKLYFSYYKKMNVTQILVSILIVYCIIFPADKLNIKEVILLLTLAWGYLSDKKCFKISKYIFEYAIVFPGILVVYAILRGVNIGSILSYAYVWVYLLLLPIILKKQINIMNPFLGATYFVALVIDFIMLTDVVGLFSLSKNPVAIFFNSMNELQGIGKGSLATFGYSIFYKSCPLILITYGYFISRKKYLFAAPLLLSMLACGTRANFLMALFITALIPTLCTEKISNKVLIILLLVGAGLYLLPRIYDQIVTLNALKYDRSDLIKTSDVKIIINNMKNSISNFILGTGVGSSFMSSRGKLMTTFEMSYVDYFRQVGLCGFIIFAHFLIKPLRVLFEKERWLFICYVAYLAVAFTNPLLVTSTSFMLYLLVYRSYMLDI